MLFDNLGIIGVGLIGASVALAAKKHKLVSRVIGFGRNEERLSAAKELGIIDDFTVVPQELALMVNTGMTNVIIFATPLETYLPMVEQIKPYLRQGTIISDVGSVKGKVVAAMESVMPEGVFFVGVHPIAGKESSGFENADDSLFNSAKCIITPTDKTDKRSLDLIISFWQKIGTSVVCLKPDEHDEIYSSVSHMPHVLAYALVNSVCDINHEFLQYGGSGFYDTTRIAISPASIWTDICFMNRDNILTHLESYIKTLNKIAGFLKTGQRDAFSAEVERARRLREELQPKGNNKRVK